MVKTNFRGHGEGCRCGGNETSRNTILQQPKKNDKEEGKFFPKAVPFFRPDEKIGVGEKKKGEGELLSHEFKISRCSKQSFRYGYAIHLSKVV